MHLRGRERMYSNIYVALDNSEHSDAASTVALELATAFGAQVIGMHVYAARMHDYRFKQMEYTLPEEYQDEAELLRQRRIHDSLITTGLELISDSYTDVLRFRCLERGVPFSARMRDGRNWEELVADVDESEDVDVVVMGALGTGAVKESQLGSVTERVARRIRRDLLIIRTTGEAAMEGDILVAIDGSPAVVRRAAHGAGAGARARQAGRGGGGLRPLPPLRGVQRHRRRALREGVEGVPLQGAGGAPRGDHRHRARQDLRVAPAGGASHRRRGGGRPADHAARRQGLRARAAPRARDPAVAARARPHRRALRRRHGHGQQHRAAAAPGALQRPGQQRQLHAADRRARRRLGGVDAGGRGAHGGGARRGARAGAHRGAALGDGARPQRGVVRRRRPRRSTS